MSTNDRQNQTLSDLDITKGFTEPTEEMLCKAVDNDPDLLIHIKNPSLAVQLSAVYSDGHAIRYLQKRKFNLRFNAPSYKDAPLDIEYENAPYVVQMAAIKREPDAIKHIHNPSPEIQILAVTRSLSSAAYISNQCPEVIKEIFTYIEDYPMALEYITNQTEEIVIQAIRLNQKCKDHIKIPLTDNIISEIVIKSI